MVGDASRPARADGGPSTTAAGIDPEIVAYLRSISVAHEPRVAELTPTQARARLARRRAGAGSVSEMASFADLALPGADGELDCRLYRPSRDVDLVIVYFHGGGWVTGDLQTADGSARRLAKAAGAEVLSVNYRLAPEHRFPAAVHDARLATEWAAEHIATGRALALAGDSAGGALAAVCASARHRPSVPISAQLLAYPVTDCDMQRASYRRRLEIYPLVREDMEWYWQQYVPDPRQRVDPDASPLRADDLSDAAPAVFVLAAHDPLLDEGRAYARALERAGVSVRSFEYATAVHGFLGMPGRIALRDRALADACGALRELAFQHTDHSNRTRRAE